MTYNDFDPQLAMDVLKFKNNIRTNKEIALKAKISKSNLNRLCSEENSDVGVITLQKIANAYEIPLWELIRYGQLERQEALTIS